MINSEIKQVILQNRRKYVDELIAIATNPLTAAGQVIQASRLLEKTLRDIELEEEQHRDDEESMQGMVIQI